jgi:hypothetical protein
MAVYFDGMPSPSEMATYMTWCPPSIPPVRGQPGSFDSASAIPGALTPRTSGGTPLDLATPRDSPHLVFVDRHSHRRHLSTESTIGTPLDPSPPSRPRVNTSPLTSRPRIDAGCPSTSRIGASPLSSPSSRGASPASTSQDRSSLANSSSRVSPSGPRQACGRGCGRGCCRGRNDDVDDGAHDRSGPDQQARPSDLARVASAAPGSMCYRLNHYGMIVDDHDGRCARRYLLELITLHIRNVYEPATYQIEAMVSAFHARFPMHPDHVVDGVWLRQ